MALDKMEIPNVGTVPYVFDTVVGMLQPLAVGMQSQ